MSEPPAQAAAQPVASPPVSTFTGPVAELIAQRMVQPPTRPGLLGVLDHFEMIRMLGGGGMGMVFLAREPATGRDVAIKVVRADLVTNQQMVHRFLKEAGHLKRLRHSNIVSVLEISDRAECPYFVMPYFEQGSLASRIKPGQPLGTDTILDIATQLAEGLSFAHRSGIIHRDLKPANILLGDGGQVFLADFGLARTVFNDSIVNVETREGEGTAPYMSPALAAGDAEDTRCDIYSFGALLYEMLTGQPPYQGQGTREILNQILAGPPRPILNCQPDADRGLVAVAEKAMARELRNRYADMRDLLADLQQIRQGQTPASLAPATNARVLKFVWIPFGILGVALLGWFLGVRHSEPVAVVRPVAPAPVSPKPVAVVPMAPVPVAPAPAAPTPVPLPAIPVVPAAPAAPAAPLPSSVPVPTAVFGQPRVGGYADGSGSQARFRLPNGVAADLAGNIYVADTANNVIRKITSDGLVSTAAGTAGASGDTDETGSQARFQAPFGLAVDRLGNVYVADTVNNTIRKISPDGIVRTLAGLAGHPGSDDGLGSIARFRNPWGVAVDLWGNVFVADASNDAIRKISPTGHVTTLAGLAGDSGQNDGPGDRARFNHPYGVAVDGAGNVYVSDSGNQTIRRITAEGVVVTIAGLAGHAGHADGGPTDARFNDPEGLAVDALGNIYVADAGNNLVRKISPLGIVTTLSPPTGDGARWNNPGGIAVDVAGNILVADTSNHCIRKLAPSLR